MTLKNIKDVKSILTDAQINKSLTKMFLDGVWHLTMDFEIITSFELFELIDYCKDNNLIISIGKRIYIQ